MSRTYLFAIALAVLVFGSAADAQEDPADPSERVSDRENEDGATWQQIKDRTRASLSIEYDRIRPLKAITINYPNGDAERHYYFIYRLINSAPREDRAKDKRGMEGYGEITSANVYANIEVKAVANVRDVVKTVLARKENPSAPEVVRTYRDLDNDFVVREIARAEGFWSVPTLRLRLSRYGLPWDAVLDDDGFPAKDKFGLFADKDPIFGQIAREGFVDAPGAKPTLFARPLLFGAKWLQRRYGVKYRKDASGNRRVTGKPKVYTHDVVLWDHNYKRTLVAKKGEPITVVRYKNGKPDWKLDSEGNRIPRKNRVGMPDVLKIRGRPVPRLDGQGNKVYDSTTQGWEYQIAYEVNMDPLPEYEPETYTLRYYDENATIEESGSGPGARSNVPEPNAGEEFPVTVLQPTVRKNSQMWCVALFGPTDRFWKQIRIQVRGLRSSVFWQDLELVKQDETFEITVARSGDQYFRDQDYIRVVNERWIRSKPELLSEEDN